MQRLRLIVLVLAVHFFVPSYATGEDQLSWPQFHGPKRDNISTETGLLKQWPSGGPKLLWRAEGLGFGYSTVAIAGGMIFTAGNIEDDTVVIAMDMDGKILWKEKNGRAWGEPYPGTRGTPTVDGDRLYHESPHGDVTCFEVKTGKKLWSVNILEKFQSKNIHWALSESLLIDGDRVICCPGGPEASMVALNKLTGEAVWKAASVGDLASYTSPILAECQGLRMIITLTLQAMIGVNADTGELLWKTKHTALFDENIPDPIYHDGHVYVSTLGAGTVKWRIKVDGKSVSVEKGWHSRDLDNQHGGVILLNGYLYGSSTVFNKGKWVCLDAATGGLAYAVNGVGRGALTCADGMFYMLNQKGLVGLVPPNPAEYKVISQFNIPPGGEGPTWAHPVVCGGRLYIRHGQFLYAYDVKATE
ncbi:MAG: PQQ-binding-like beta-propeller repeat protein [Planctomycetota bacterium]